MKRGDHVQSVYDRVVHIVARAPSISPRDLFPSNITNGVAVGILCEDDEGDWWWDVTEMFIVDEPLSCLLCIGEL